FYTPSSTYETYPLSLHDALPISEGRERVLFERLMKPPQDNAPPKEVPTLREFVSTPARRSASSSRTPARGRASTRDRRQCNRRADRKSTRLNSSHVSISYAVFCL